MLGPRVGEGLSLNLAIVYWLFGSDIAFCSGFYVKCFLHVFVLSRIPRMNLRCYTEGVCVYGLIL